MVKVTVKGIPGGMYAIIQKGRLAKDATYLNTTHEVFARVAELQASEVRFDLQAITNANAEG